MTCYERLTKARLSCKFRVWLQVTRCGLKGLFTLQPLTHNLQLLYQGLIQLGRVPNAHGLPKCLG